MCLHQLNELRSKLGTRTQLLNTLVLFLFLSFSLSVSLAQTSMTLFKNKDFSVKRRFSDFLGLHSKLASKYLHIGYIVPPAPEKSIVGKRHHLDPEHGVCV